MLQARSRGRLMSRLCSCRKKPICLWAACVRPCITRPVLSRVRERKRYGNATWRIWCRNSMSSLIGRAFCRLVSSSGWRSASVLLNRPQVVFLDEASSAMDEGLEYAMYKLLRQSLPDAILVSVGHRSSLLEFHTQGA